MSRIPKPLEMLESPERGPVVQPWSISEDYSEPRANHALLLSRVLVDEIEAFLKNEAGHHPGSWDIIAKLKERDK
jgi:hypothetical protein